MISKQHIAALATGLMCVLVWSRASAYWDFTPTAIEWESWPIYCRVQYSWVNQGYDYQYGGSFPPATVEAWRTLIGDRTFAGLHHFCASMHFLNRARAEPEPNRKKFLLDRAWEDASFSYVRSDPQSPVYPNISVTVAQIQIAMGKSDEAEEVLKKAIAAQPKRSEAYVALALLYRKERNLSQARETLTRADRATGGQSIEIQYDLGLIDLELGDVDSAVTNAKKAYAGGYPLPGLKRKLQRLGRWSGPSTAAAN